MALRAGRPVSAYVAGVFLVLAAIAAWQSFGGLWTTVGTERLQYRGMTPLARVEASTWGLADPGVLDFWHAHLRRGDRYFLNVPPSTKAISNWLPVLGLLTNYYLVPAERVLEASRATVVLSWGLPPRRAGVRLTSTTRDGHTDAFISRVAG
jgi:hypothetical protein